MIKKPSSSRLRQKCIRVLDKTESFKKWSREEDQSPEPRHYRGPQAAPPLHSTDSPLSGSEVARRASTEVASVRVGAAKLAGVLGGGALVDVGAAAASLLVVEAGRAEAAEASQRVVARGPPTDLTVQALVLIWGLEEVEG